MDKLDLITANIPFYIYEIKRAEKEEQHCETVHKYVGKAIGDFQMYGWSQWGYLCYHDSLEGAWQMFHEIVKRWNAATEEKEYYLRLKHEAEAKWHEAKTKAVLDKKKFEQVWDNNRTFELGEQQQLFV